MTREQLVEQIKTKGNYLCVGLDSEIEKIPHHLRGQKDPVFEFNKQIIDATKDHCVSYKINTAFYEANGLKGWETLEKTINYIPSTHFRIADAKRGDIGNTSAQYAKAFFETMPFDAITVAPYMGSDSVRPFLEYENKWTIILGLTSNPGSADFEMQKLGEEFLYERVLRTAAAWGSASNTMFVIGATHPQWFEKIREITPHHFYLVPGVGAQGGSLQDISHKAMNEDCGLLVNASRAIIFAGSGENFAELAAERSKAYAQEMSGYVSKLS